MIAAFLVGAALPVGAALAAQVGARGRDAGPIAAVLAAATATAAVVAAGWYFAAPRARAAWFFGGVLGGGAAAARAAAAMAAARTADPLTAAGEATLIFGAFGLLLWAAGAPAAALNRPEWAALCGLALAAVAVSTPWWAPVEGSFVPAEVAAYNPWLRIVSSAGGVDWIRMAGLYPVVGAAYTSPPERTAAVVPWAAVVLAGGAASRITRRLRSTNFGCGAPR